MIKYLYSLLFFILIQNSYAKANIQIVTEFMPPLQLAKYGQDMTGVSAEFVNAVVEDTKLPSVSNVYPWARSYALATSQPNVLIFPIIRTKARENNFHWIGKIWGFSAAVYSNKDDINITTLEGAKNYNISVYRGDFFHHYLLEQGFSPDKLFPVVNIEQSIELFVNGRVDLIVIDNSIFEFYLTKSNKTISEYKQLIVLNNIKESNAFIALSKTTSLDVVDIFIDSFKRVSSRHETKSAEK